MICRSNMTVKKCNSATFQSFEVAEQTVSSIASSRARLSVIYRSPYSPAHAVTTNTFLTEFANYLESFVLCTEPILICGDFNIHVDDSTDIHALALNDLLNSMALQQHVVTPTQIHSHTLDLMITRATDNLIPEVPLSDCYLSDHVTVLCKLQLEKAKPTTQPVKKVNKKS